MTATATAADEAKGFVEAVGVLKTLGADLKEAVKDLGSPLRAHVNGDSTAMSYWDGEGETCVVKLGPDGPQEMTKKIKTSLAKGYSNKVFKTMGGWIQEGYKAHKEHTSGEFKAKNEAITKAVQGLTLQDGQSAGYFVLPEFNEKILERIYANDLWSRTDNYTVNNNMIFIATAETSRVNGARHGGLRGYWVDEAASLTKSKPTFRRVELNLKKVAVLVYLTDELIADGGPGLEKYIAAKTAEEFNFLFGDSIFNGNGNGQPLGILNAPALLSIAKETGQAATTLVTENLDKLWARRFVGGNYAWYHNQDCGPQLDRLTQDVGTGGVVLYRDADGLVKPMPQALKGVPRVEIEFAKTLGTAGDIYLADLKQFLTISKGGINQAYSTHVEFLTDQTAIRFTMRVNGRPWEASPVTPYQGSNTQASFLNVAVRA